MHALFMLIRLISFFFCGQKMHPSVSLQLLEYDKRFEQYGSDYTYYDFNKPHELPLELKNAFKVVVADPPYLVRILFQLKVFYHKLHAS